MRMVMIHGGELVFQMFRHYQRFKKLKRKWMNCERLHENINHTNIYNRIKQQTSLFYAFFIIKMN